MADAASGLSYRAAVLADVPALVALVNGAYRGDGSRRGWTTEADLLDGTRTDAEEVADFIADPHSLMLLCEQRGELLGSAHLNRDGNDAYLGMFTVRPVRQGQGIGTALLATAEGIARERFGADRMRMQVISLRTELIAFYERRGYRPTGETGPFPRAARYGTPRVHDLRLLVLEKPLT